MLYQRLPMQYRTPDDGHGEGPKHVSSCNKSQDNTVASRQIYLYMSE
jgi:hypothetical protein